MERWNLSVRKIAHVDQRARGSLKIQRDDLTRSINLRFANGGTLSNIPPKFLLNMDQTAIHFESKSTYTVARTGVKNVPTKGSGSDSKRCTVVVTIAADGTKHPPFFVFKGQPGKTLERSLLQLNIKWCCQVNAWFDELVALKWVDAILEPYVGVEENAFLLIDHYSVQFLGSFVRACNNIGVEADYIPKGCTCVTQPVDVGFNGPFKRHVKDKFRVWQIVAYRGNNFTKLPTPDKEDIIKWDKYA
jgi:DDE superfamily endonuclease